MNTSTVLTFSLTVLPLICTPGPDVLFITSQALSSGRNAGFKATLGVLLGYLVHSIMLALGLSVLIAKSPMLFEAIRFAGVTYLIYLAYKLIRAALFEDPTQTSGPTVNNQVSKGFLTSLLNPKGALIFIAIFPQFIELQSPAVTMNAIILSMTFILICAFVYGTVTVAVARMSRRNLNGRLRKKVDGAAGGMILVAAGLMALSHG